MINHNSPREYEVLQRPPRDFFTPIAKPIAKTLFLLSLIAIPCLIGFASHNLADRQPSLTQPPAASSYASDYQASPTVDLTETKIHHLTAPARVRDRNNLLLHLHQHITAHGGQLVHAQIHPGEPPPVKDETLREIPRNGHIYHVNGQYLELLQILDQPDWDNPTYYAKWTEAVAPPQVPTLSQPDTYVSISTKYLWFESTRVRFLTNIISASITAALLTAVTLSLLISLRQDRTQAYYQ